MLESSYIKKCAKDLGFSLCGVAPYKIMSQDALYLQQWLDGGYNSALSYMNRYQDIRKDASLLLSGLKSVIVLAVNYKNHDILYQSLDNSAKLASYAMNLDYHYTLRAMAEDLRGLLEDKFGAFASRICVDSAPIFEKSWAVRAGLGGVGRNSLLITPEYGSTVLVCELLIDCEVDFYDKPLDFTPCEDCDICLKACPGGAIMSNKTLDASKCISALTTYHKGADRSVAGWVFGCDMCQRVCPHNKKTPNTTDPRFLPVVEPQYLDKSFWLSALKADFKRVFGKTPIGGSKFALIRGRFL